MHKSDDQISEDDRFEVVIVGAGPAGLSAAAALGAERGTLLLEAGRGVADRDRSDPEELLAGVGGAGLFSDGKHSLHPAATALWRLADRGSLRAALDATSRFLAEHGVAMPNVLPPDAPSDARPAAAPSPTWIAKPYPSIYVSLEERRTMIERLWQAAPQRAFGTRLVAVERRGGELHATVERDGARRTLATRHLVLATGRWSPRHLPAWIAPSLGVVPRYQRVELGLRLEARHDHPLFATLPGVDGKLRFVLPSGDELRTFCTCRRGEVVLGSDGTYAAFSGRADGPPTGRSNVGLMVRIGDEGRGREVLAALDRVAPPQRHAASLSLADWQAHGADVLAPRLGAPGARLVDEALRHFVALCPALLDDAARVALYAPALEGVGDYPTTAPDELALGHGLWVAGDVCGRFRGIVAAMISGRYVAAQIRKERR